MLLIAKLALTPLGIAAVTVAARRWGPAAAGWFTGFPLTSGPVSLFLALEQGQQFASRSAVATLAALIASGSFSVVYSLVSRYRSWLFTAAVALATYGAVIVALESIGVNTFRIAPTFVAVLLVNAMIAALLPPGTPGDNKRPPPWDLALRMATATLFVLALTGAAAYLGPAATGLLSPFPVFATVLAVFTHAHSGVGAVQQLLRAFVIGQFAFASFFLVVAFGLTRLTLPATYAVATGVALAVNLGCRPLLALRPA